MSTMTKKTFLEKYPEFERFVLTMSQLVCVKIQKSFKTHIKKYSKLDMTHYEEDDFIECAREFSKNTDLFEITETLERILEKTLDKYFIRKQKIINTIDKLFHGTPELLSALIYNNILKNLENLENAKERT